jgi:hypothetical protein
VGGREQEFLDPQEFALKKNLHGYR